MLSRRQFLQIDRLQPATAPLTVSRRCLAAQRIECYTCVETCPPGAISLARGDAAPHIDFARCTRCGDCVPVCPAQAIALTPAPRALTEKASA